MKYWLIVAGLLLSLPGWAQGFTQEQLRSFAKGANVQFSVISNLSEGGAKAQLLVNNQSEFALPAGAGNWAIYFHAIRKLSAPSQAGLSLAQVQGDLYRLAPTADFTGLAKGQALSFVYQLSSSMVSYTDFMPRAFIVSGNLAPEVFANTDTEVLSQFVAPLQQAEQLQRSAVDQVPMATSQQRYRVNQARARRLWILPV